MTTAPLAALSAARDNAARDLADTMTRAAALRADLVAIEVAEEAIRAKIADLDAAIVLLTPEPETPAPEEPALPETPEDVGEEPDPVP